MPSTRCMHDLVSLLYSQPLPPLLPSLSPPANARHRVALTGSLLAYSRYLESPNMSTRVAPAPPPSSSSSSPLGRRGLSRRKMAVPVPAAPPSTLTAAAASWEASATGPRRRQSLGSLLGLCLASTCACISNRLSKSARRIFRLCTLLILSSLVFAVPCAMMFTSWSEWDATPKLLVRFASSPTTLHLDLLDSSLRLIEGPPGSNVTLQATSATSSTSACTVRHVGEDGTHATSEHCHLELRYPHRETATGGLELNFTTSPTERSEFRSELIANTPLVLRNLMVEGERLDISLDDVFVKERLGIHVVHGDVSLTNLNSSVEASLHVRSDDGEQYEKPWPFYK